MYENKEIINLNNLSDLSSHSFECTKKIDSPSLLLPSPPENISLIHITAPNNPRLK